MAEKKVVLVTGVASFWGRRTAEQLLLHPQLHVIGLDNEQPQPVVSGLDFIQADVRNPRLVDLLQSEGVHTVCHLKFVESARPSEAALDVNVMGTMKVLGACAQAGVKKVILKSSTAVYGAHPDNSAYLTEDSPLNGSRAYGYTRDMIEIEAFINGFRRQQPEMIISLLRFASIVGPSADTPLTRFLQEPRTPVLLGFDPMMQVLHEQDALGALVHAAVHDFPGVFNVAAEGVLPLSRLMGLAGKLALPVFHPLAYWGTAVMGNSRLGISRYLPIELDYLRYPWVGDLQKMRAELGFAPRYSAVEALREFSSKQRLRRFLPEKAALEYDEQRLQDTIERRNRQRAANLEAEAEEVEND